MQAWWLWRESDYDMQDEGELVYFEFASEDDAIYAFNTILEEEEDYYEVNIQVTENKNVCRAVADEFEYAELLILSRIGKRIAYLYMDYDDTASYIDYDYAPLEIFDDLGY